MIFTASLLITTAAAIAPGITQDSSQPSVAAQANATVRILAGVYIRFDDGALLAETSGKAEPIIRRDTSGTLWAEFS